MEIKIIIIQTKLFCKTCTPPKMAVMGKRYVREPAGGKQPFILHSEMMEVQGKGWGRVCKRGRSDAKQPLVSATRIPVLSPAH